MWDFYTNSNSRWKSWMHAFFRDVIYKVISKVKCKKCVCVKVKRVNWKRFENNRHHTLLLAGYFPSVQISKWPLPIPKLLNRADALFNCSCVCCENVPFMLQLTIECYIEKIPYTFFYDRVKTEKSDLGRLDSFQSRIQFGPPLEREFDSSLPNSRIPVSIGNSFCQLCRRCIHLGSLFSGYPSLSLELKLSMSHENLS